MGKTTEELGIASGHYKGFFFYCTLSHVRQTGGLRSACGLFGLSFPLAAQESYKNV